MTTPSPAPSSASQASQASASNGEASWRPIETVPKDGTSVMLYPHYVISAWEADVGGFERWSEYMDCAVRHTTKFTHWMPLPPPPAPPPPKEQRT